MNRTTILLLFRLTFLTLSLTKILLIIVSMIFLIIHWKKLFENKKPPLATRQTERSHNLLIRAWFDVVPTVKIKGAFYIISIILTLETNLKLSSNLADTIFGNRIVILAVKAEM